MDEDWKKILTRKEICEGLAATAALVCRFFRHFQKVRRPCACQTRLNQIHVILSGFVVLLLLCDEAIVSLSYYLLS